MKYYTTKILIYGFLIIGVTAMSFGVFNNAVSAQYFYSNSPTNTSSDYAYYRQLCPADFKLTVYNNNQYMCYKLLGNANNNVANNTYYNNYNNNLSNYNYNSTSNNVIPGCLPGYIFSEFTGQRCDGNFYYNNNYNYNNNTYGTFGNIRNFDVRDGRDNNPRENDNNAELIEVRFDVDGGEIRLDRIELGFEFTGYSSGEKLPWNTFERIRLLLDGSEIARTSTDNRNDWDRESNNTYRLVFSGLDKIIRSNARARLTLEADLQSNIGGTNNNYTSWKIFIPDNGLRARDGSGNIVYAGNNRDTASVDIRGN